MKKIIFNTLALGALLMGATSVATAQQADRAPFHIVGQQEGMMNKHLAGGINKTAAMWDTEFSFSYADSMVKAGAPGGLAAAGVAFLNDEFWVSEWNSDTVAVFNKIGQFKKFLKFTAAYNATTGGIRSFTSDGQYLFAASNSQRLFRIDTATKVILPINVAAAVGPVRYATFDASLNNGLGGFWVGNFQTNLTPISRTGAVLAAVTPIDAAAISEADSRYGIAYDATSLTGPFIWGFHQLIPGSSQSGSYISQISVANGATTGVQRDVNADLGVPTGGTNNPIAGGIFITDAYTAGKRTMCGVVQGFRIFGYDLAFTPSMNDVRVTRFGAASGMGHMPQRHLQPMQFDGEFANSGANAQSGTATMTVLRNGSPVFTDNSNTFSNVGFASTQGFTSGIYTPSLDTGKFVAKCMVDITPNVDESLVNNTREFPFYVTDTTMAHDNGDFDGFYFQLPVQPSDPLEFGALYTPLVDDTLTSVSMVLRFIEVASDFTYATLYDADGGTFTQLAISDTVNFTDPNQLDFTLRFPTPQPLAAGKPYLVTVYQNGGDSVILASSGQFFFPDNFYIGSAGQFNASTVETVRAIRMNLGKNKYNSIANNAINGNVRISPNPTTGAFSVDVKLAEAQAFTIEVMDMQGKVQYSEQAARTASFQKTLSLNLAAGVYAVRVRTESGVSIQKLMIE